MSASGGHLLQQQKADLQTSLKTLVNNDLKEICRAYSKQVSGNKADLQRRCIEILNDIVSRGDPGQFEDFKWRVQNHGKARPVHDSNGYGSPAGGHSHDPMAPGRGYGITTQNRLPVGGKYFKPSPFYEIVDTVLPLTDLPGGPEMPQNRNTVRTQIRLSDDQAAKMATGMRLLMYCGLATGLNHPTQFHPVDVAFPNQLEVRINEDDVKHNFKGLKNKAGSTKPADLTGKVRSKPSGYVNQIVVQYALTAKPYFFVIYLVRYITAATLTERIKANSVIPKDKVLAEMRKANADPDIEATSTRMSLKDPISTVRIELPVRSTVCSHTQCFDGAMFMQLVEQAPQWNCPVCNKTVSFQSLCVDKYFEDILKRTPKHIEKVDVEPDGEWRMIQEEEDDQPAGGAGKARASYDDDFDDDVVEILDGPTNKQINGIKRESQPPGFLSPTMGPGFSINTPPLSSREASVAQSTASANRAGNKRPSGAVIDLTLSDEDDDPPRPAKRQHTSTTAPSAGNQGTSHTQTSYHTPASLPDRNSYQPPSAFRQADIYRPPTAGDYTRQSSTGYRPPSQAALAPPVSPQYGRPSMNGDRSTPSNSGSPAHHQHSTSPGDYSNFLARPTSQPWSAAAQHSRPPSQPHPFSIRPPGSPGGMLQSPEMRQDGSSGYRLPPIQTLPPPPGLQPPPQQELSFGGWRSDRESFHNSPG